MKHIVRNVFLALVLCAAVLCIGGTTAQAATINRDVCGESAWGAGKHTFKADLNGNGTSETVTVNITEGEYYLKSIKVTANGYTLLSKDVSTDWIYRIRVRFVRMNSGRNFLQIYGMGDDDCVPFNILYRYSKSAHKLVIARDFADYFGRPGAITSVTSDSVKVQYIAQPCQLGYISYTLTYKYDTETYKMNLAGSIVSAKSSLGGFSDFFGDGLAPYFAKNQFKTARSLTFYTQPGGGSKAFTVSKGKFVTLTKVKVTKSTIYAQFKYGDKTAWKGNIKNYNSGDPYFEGVYNRLAG